jgi:cation transport ATPase
VTVAVLAWIISGEPVRFLAVLVIATPCPLLIAIPIAIIGSISLTAHVEFTTPTGGTVDGGEHSGSGSTPL